MKPNNSTPRPTIQSSYIRCLLVVLLMPLMSNCATSPPRHKVPEDTPKVASAPQPTNDGKPAQFAIEQRLRNEISKWKGTPHRLGGTRKNGVDCSGFVQRVFNDLFRVKLPRTAALQVHSGKAVPATHLRPGDLVFFHPPQKIRHVGIYLGRGEFAHASTSRGVIISRMDTAYWRNSYWTARRIPAIAG